MSLAVQAAAPRERVRATPDVRRLDHVFYCGMGLAVAAAVLVGFSPTFFMRSHFGGPELNTLRIVHGSVFSAWIALFIVQTLLIGTRRTAVHRKLGVAGAVLAAAMVVLGLVLAISAARAGRAPPGLPPLPFLIIPVFDMLVFAPLVAAAVYYRGSGETHKRLMLLATVSIAAPAFGRMPLTLIYGPLFFFGMVDLLVLAGPVYDWITRRRLHPAYVWGGTAIIASQVIRLALSGTAAWLAVANALIRL